MTDEWFGPDDPMSEAVAEALSHPHRRFTLAYLSQQERSISLEELAAHLAAWEADVSVADLDDRDVRATMQSLYSVHLPTLAESGLVGFDRHAEPHVVTVTRGGEMAIEEFADEAEFDLQHYYVE